MISLLRRFDSAVAAVEAWALTGLVLAMTGIAMAQVVLRNLWPDHALTWADVTVRHMVFWVGFLGASLAASRGKHLAIDILTHYISPAAKARAAGLTNLMASFIAGMLAWQAWRFLQIEGDRTFIVLPLGFGMVSLRFLLAAAAGQGGAGSSPSPTPLPNPPPQGGRE